jgi:threonine aldolase
VPLRRIARGFDTVSLCLSKGLGAPVGSVLAGRRADIDRAVRIRKRLGGGMRQAGLLAAAGTHALAHHVERLADDHARARAFAEAIAELPGVRLEPATVQTNLVYFELASDHPMGVDGGVALLAALAERGVAMTGGGGRLRAAFHLDVDDDGLALSIAAMRAAL